MHIQILRLLLMSTTMMMFAFACNTAGTNAPDSFDQQFIDMMVPHHQGAVEMAKIAQERGEHPEIKQMAGAVIRAQEDEIGKMKAWRKSWHGSDQTPPMSQMPMVPGMPGMEGHGGAGATMNMADDVEKLRSAPAPFDKAFIDAMIPHHQSAIDAAKAAETRAQKPEIKELSRAIIADQQREIDQMKQWRQAWYGSTGYSVGCGEGGGQLARNPSNRHADEMWGVEERI